MNTNHKRIVGIDLSLTATGLALIDTGKLADIHTLKSEATGPTIDAFLNRTWRIAQAIQEFSSSADLIVIEGLSMHSKSSSLDKIIGCWWLVVNHLRDANPDAHVVIVTPTQRAKYATGNGKDGKDAVMLATARRYADAPIRDNNQADALLLADMGARYLGCPLIENLPNTHLMAMNAVNWPNNEDHT